jgi:hypothetical protein
MSNRRKINLIGLIDFSIRKVFTIVIYSYSINSFCEQNDYIYNIYEIELYTIKIVDSDFNKEIVSRNKSENFKELRKYLSKKTYLLNQLEIKYNRINLSYDSDTIEIDQKIDEIRELLKNSGEKLKVHKHFYSNNIDFTDNEYLVPDSISVRKSEIQSLLKKYEAKRGRILQLLNQEIFLAKNIDIVENDITVCNETIDFALAPEYKEQEFRKTISITFSILIGVLLTVFFFIIFKKSDQTVTKDLLSGNGLQFITLFVLIIAIILFGILNILKGSELAAILSGISGYILGKGIQTGKSSQTKNDLNNNTE